MNFTFVSTVSKLLTMIMERALSVIAGMCLGVVIALIVIISLSKDLLLGILFGISLGIGLTMFIYEHFKAFDHRNQGNGGLATCTCQANQINCEDHDPRLLMDLSCNISEEQLMTRLGIELSVNPNTIRSCRENNRNSIEQATFDMLYHKWYKRQDGLGPESEGLKILENALRKVECDTYIQTIVQRHFLNGWCTICSLTLLM